MGVFVKKGDKFYADFMVWRRPRMDPGAGQAPELVMFRCSYSFKR